MIIWVDFVQDFMFIVFTYCILSLILNPMEISVDISVDGDTFIEAHALSEFL